VLNHKYLISAFLNGRHPLRRLLAVLSGLSSTKMVREFDMVGSLIHSLVYEIKEACWRLKNNGYEIHKI
jgi:hypothetical protein